MASDHITMAIAGCPLRRPANARVNVLCCPAWFRLPPRSIDSTLVAASPPALRRIFGSGGSAGAGNAYRKSNHVLAEWPYPSVPDARYALPLKDPARTEKPRLRTLFI